MIVLQRDVGDEVGDRSPLGTMAVRRSEGIADRSRQAGGRDSGGPADEGRCATADQIQHPRLRASRITPGAGELGLMHRGVGQHDPTQLLAMGQCPAESDRPSPVMGQQHHRTVEAEHGGQIGQVINALGQPPRPVGSLE